MSDRVTMNPYVTSDVADLESPDDIKLADQMKTGREQIIRELRKVIIGQEEVINQVLNTLFVGGNSLIVGAPGLAKTLVIPRIAEGGAVRCRASAVHARDGAGAGAEVRPHPVRARPDAVRHHGHRPRAGRRRDRPPPDGV